MKRLIFVSFATLVATAAMSAATVPQSASVKTVKAITTVHGDPSLPNPGTGVPPGGSGGGSGPSK